MDINGHKCWKANHPDHQEFKYRLWSYILDYKGGILSANTNLEIDNTSDLELNYSLTGKCRH